MSYIEHGSSTSRLVRPVVAAVSAPLAALALAACSGGGNDAADPSSAAPTTGSVAVLFTDAPHDQFCQVRATVTAIDLLGTSGPTNLYTGSRTVNLLAMRNFSDFFAIDADVPIGTYEKVRLTLSDLALVECDDAGQPEPESGWEHPHLPGNGKLDLNPRGAFEVVGGETLVIELDLDMEKSLHLHQAGNGRWQFRPVVFVTIRPDDRRLVRVFGSARSLGANAFELCPVEPAATVGPAATSASSECLDVYTDAKTGLFDRNGDPAGLSALAANDLLTAIGFLGLHDDADGDTRNDDLKLDAVVLEFGPRGTFARLPGTVVSAPGNNDIFVFDPLSGEAIDARLQSGTRIFAIDGDTELTSAALQPGATGEVDGVFTVPATSGEPLKSSLVVLDQDATPAMSVLDATIKAIATDDDAVAATRRFEVDTATVTAQCIKTDAQTRYLKITESGTASETAEVTFAELAVGDKVDVYGDADAVDAACVLADVVQEYVAVP